MYYRFLTYILPALLLTGCSAQLATRPPNSPVVAVHFSPDGGCTTAIVAALDTAKQTVKVQAYSFTSAPITKALVDAHKRGVKVQVILDKSNRTAKYSSADFIAHAGINCLIDDKHQIAHNKIIIIDDTTVITGSFNFSQAAESENAENLLVINSRELCVKYVQNWQNHANHSAAYLAASP